MKQSLQYLQDERFFNFTGDEIKMVASVVLKLAPFVAGAVYSTIGNIVWSVLGEEAGLVDEGPSLESHRGFGASSG